MRQQMPAPGGDASESGAERARRQSFGADLLTQLFIDPLDPGYRDAAEANAERPPPSLPSRVSRRSATAAVMAVFGLLLSVAYQQVVAEAPEAARARAKLVKDVGVSQRQTESLQDRADRLRSQVAKARDRALTDAGGNAEARRLRETEARTGMTKVAGPGVAVTLSDGPRETDPVTGEPVGDNLGRVFDRDLQRLVNALWAAGAEAVAIDRQRLSAVSTIRSAGEAIRVDFVPVSSPYLVQAIGPPSLGDALARSRAAEQFRWLRDKYRMGFSISSQDRLTLPAASDPQLRHAKPAPDPHGSSSPTGGD
ncbi:MAG: DUF881 domain-containing protein [Micromonosporaceae bacterium]